MGCVQFKDEYKRRNAELEKLNEQLKCENEQLFSATVNERDSRIAELEKSEISFKQQMSSLHAQCRSDSVIFSLFLTFIDSSTRHFLHIHLIDFVSNAVVQSHTGQLLLTDIIHQHGLSFGHLCHADACRDHS